MFKKTNWRLLLSTLLLKYTYRYCPGVKKYTTLYELIETTVCEVENENQQ